jgi:hypothetical protein
MRRALLKIVLWKVSYGYFNFSVMLCYLLTTQMSQYRNEIGNERLGCEKTEVLNATLVE